MPSKCPDCGGKMGPLCYGKQFNKNYKLVSPSFVDGMTIYRSCACGCVIVWGWPNSFIRRHVLPLFDMKESREVLGNA